MTERSRAAGAANPAVPARSTAAAAVAPSSASAASAATGAALAAATLTTAPVVADGVLASLRDRTRKRARRKLVLVAGLRWPRRTHRGARALLCRALGAAGYLHATHVL